MDRDLLKKALVSEQRNSGSVLLELIGLAGCVLNNVRTCKSSFKEDKKMVFSATLSAFVLGGRMGAELPNQGVWLADPSFKQGLACKVAEDFLLSACPLALLYEQEDLPARKAAAQKLLNAAIVLASAFGISEHDYLLWLEGARDAA